MINRLTIGFNLKILLSLIGLIGGVVLAILIFTGYQTKKQINNTVRRVTEQSQKKFGEIEELYQSSIKKYRSGFTNNPRISGALEASIEDNDPEYLIEAVEYELKLSQIRDSILIFSDSEGNPFAAMHKGEKIDLPEGDIILQESGDKIRYSLLNNTIYAVQVVKLYRVGRHIGSLLFGLPLDQTTADQLSTATDSEVCFVHNNESVLSTFSKSKKKVEEQAVQAISDNRPRIRTLNGTKWAFISTPLNFAGQNKLWSVLSKPLADEIAPLERIKKATIAVGLVGLIVAGIIGAGLSRSLTAPIKRLVEATGWVKKGDYTKRVEVKTGDELSTLADSFNDMIDGLQQKEKYRGVLDKVVSPEIADELLQGEIKLGGEIKEVTTLFADIRGFTTLTEGMEPGDVISILNEYMEIAAKAIEESGGVVDKYVGDQVMALFGVPLKVEDAPLKAVEAAMKMNNSIEELNKNRKLNGAGVMHLGIGINTGEVVAGNMGSSDRLNYTVIGESVNVASRICGKAGPDEILVSKNAYTKIKDRFDAESIGEMELKGVSYPVETYIIKRKGKD